MICLSLSTMCVFFFFTDPATTEIYTLSLHDALPISHDVVHHAVHDEGVAGVDDPQRFVPGARRLRLRSEEHTSELQSRLHLVCRLLLEKKKKTEQNQHYNRYVHLFSP